jgi:hypothetical protein
MDKQKLVRVLYGTGQVLIIAAQVVARMLVRRLPPAK